MHVCSPLEPQINPRVSCAHAPRRIIANAPMPPTLRKNKSGHLPADYDVGHDLCFVLHDLLAQLLKSGVEANIFTTSIEFKDDAERIAFESAPDVFAWLDSNRRVDERAQALVGIVLPAVLSDALHCIYEAL